ncbi:MAG: hypothetical protein ACREX8_09125 [Gammaproteobacteria bacterium]
MNKPAGLVVHPGPGNRLLGREDEQLVDVTAHRRVPVGGAIPAWGPMDTGHTPGCRIAKVRAISYK